MQTKGLIALSFLLLSFSSGLLATEARVLLAVERVQLTSQGKPKKRSHAFWSSYSLLNLSTGERKLVNKAGKSRASELTLSYGVWCIRSISISGSQYLNLLNSLCFEVDSPAVVNAGTWVVGWRVSGREVYARIIDAKENFEELADQLEVTEYRVPQFFVLDPNRLDEAMEQFRRAE